MGTKERMWDDRPRIIIPANISSKYSLPNPVAHTSLLSSPPGAREPRVRLRVRASLSGHQSLTADDSTMHRRRPSQLHRDRPCLLLVHVPPGSTAALAYDLPCYCPGVLSLPVSNLGLHLSKSDHPFIISPKLARHLSCSRAAAFLDFPTASQCIPAPRCQV